MDNKEKKKFNICIIISIVLVILWMITIFWFSSQVGDDSSATSGNTIRKIVKFFYTNITTENLELIVQTLQPFVRKLAHFTIYTIGGFLLYNLSIQLKLKSKFINSLGFGILYAISDEIHQFFVPGRSCRIFDVFVDTCGLITGITFYIIIIKIINRIMKRQESKDN